MPQASSSIEPFVRLDAKKLFIIMSIVVTTLTIDSQIGYIADFIPEQLSSTGGVAAFIGIWAIFAVTQYYILAHVNQKNKEHGSKVRHLNALHKVVTIAQFVLAGVMALVILQILVGQQYNIEMLYVA